MSLGEAEETVAIKICEKKTFESHIYENVQCTCAKQVHVYMYMYTGKLQDIHNYK